MIRGLPRRIVADPSGLQATLFGALTAEWAQASWRRLRQHREMQKYGQIWTIAIHDLGRGGGPKNGGRPPEISGRPYKNRGHPIGSPRDSLFNRNRKSAP